MPAAQTIQRPQGSLSRLGHLREAVRRAFLLDGLAALALAAAGLVAVTFILDYLLSLPPAVRAVHVLLCFSALGWVFVKRLARPGRLKLRDEDLAVFVESHSPELKQALITAVELSRPDHAGAAYLSSDLINAVVQRAEEASGAIRPEGIVDLRPVLRNAVLFLALLAALIGGAIARPDLAGIWFNRFFLLGNERWPKSTLIELISPAENPVYVAMGDDLAVEARLVRGSPPSLTVDARSADGSRWRDTMIEGAGRMYRRVYENISQPFRLRIAGGDDALPEVDVRVRILPSIARLDAWFVYPEYTGLPSTPADKPVGNPSLISVLIGTRVAYRAYTDLTVAQAFVAFKARAEETAVGPRPASGAAGEKTPPKPPAGPPLGAVHLPVLEAAPRPSPVDPNGPPLPPQEKSASMFEGGFTVERDGQLSLFLLAPDGVPGGSQKTITVRAIPDQKPVVRIQEPKSSSEEVTPEATVAMEFLMRDDFGLRTASLEGTIKPSGGGDPVLRSFPLELGPPVTAAQAGRDGGKAGPDRPEHRPRFSLELGKVPGLAPGARLEYRAQAVDVGGNAGQSETYTLHILTKQDITRILNDRLMLVRDQLRDVGRQEESARKDLQAFQREVESSAIPRLDAASAGRLGRSRQDQERVTAGLKRAAEELDKILSRMEANRVGDAKEREWIEGLRREVGNLSGDSSPKAEKMIEDLRDGVRQAPREPSSIEPIADAQRKIERELQMLDFRLTEFGDVNAVIQQLRSLQQRQTDLRDRIRGRARGSSGAPAGTGTEDE